MEDMEDAHFAQYVVLVCLHTTLPSIQQIVTVFFLQREEAESS